MKDLIAKFFSTAEAPQGGSMLILFLVCAYVLCNLIIGMAFHLLSIIDIVAEPGTPELLVFFAVFAIAGVPILAVTAVVVAVSFLFGGHRVDSLDTPRIKGAL